MKAFWYESTQVQVQMIIRLFCNQVITNVVPFFKENNIIFKLIKAYVIFLLFSLFYI